MDLGRNTFELSELDEKFWEKAILVNWEPPLGDEDQGHISIITEDKKEYYIDFEGFPYSPDKLEEFSKIFVLEKGWKKAPFAKSLVREEYAEAFQNAFGEQEYSYFNVLREAGKMLDLDSLPEQTVWRQNVLLWNKRKETYDYYREKEERKKLTASDFVWKPIYPNNMEDNGESGQYTMIFAEDEDRIMGWKFSIVYQMKRTEDGFCTDEIELYNLYSKRYLNVQGPLHQPEYDQHNNSILGARSYCDCTFYDSEVNSYGVFERSFATLEDAREEVYRNSHLHSLVNKDNLITTPDDPEQERQRWLQYYGALSEFQERYEEIMKVVYEFEYPDSGCYGGGFIMDALEEKLGIGREKSVIMMEHISLLLTPRERRRVGELFEKCKRLGEELCIR